MGVTCACTDQLRSLGHTHHFSGIVKNFEAAARELFNEQHLTVVSAKVLPCPALFSSCPPEYRSSYLDDHVDDDGLIRSLVHSTIE